MNYNRPHEVATISSIRLAIIQGIIKVHMRYNAGKRPSVKQALRKKEQ
jgi:hypothetical protein